MIEPGQDALAARTDEEDVARLLAISRELAAEVHPSEAATLVVALDSTLGHDLGLDSLSRMELLSRIERRMGVSVHEEAFSRALTLRDLLREIRGKAGRPPTAPEDLGAPSPAAWTDAIPHAAATLVDVLAWHAARHPDRVHIHLYGDEGAGEDITYQTLHTEALRGAAGLLENTIEAGQTVLIMLPTGREYFVAFFSVLLAGAVPVPIYPPGHPSQMEEHLRRHAAIAGNCLARAMIAPEEARPFARLMAGSATPLAGFFTVQELLARGHGVTGEGLPRIAPLDTALLQYTSGSTGLPKGVVLSHANLLANVRSMGRAVGVSSRDVFVSWLPLYHDMGLIGAWFGSLYHACPLVIMSPLAFIARPLRWLKAIHRFRGSLAAAPNFAYDLCVRRVGEEEMDGLDLSSWRCAFNGAEAVRPETIERFVARFAPHGFAPTAMMPVYGLAESSVGLAFPPLGRGPLTDRVRREEFTLSGRAIPAEAGEDTLTFAACGRPLPGHQIRVVDALDQELPDRREGRLQFKGPSATSGYYRNPAATAGLMRGGWLDSGDLAYTVEGEIVVTGRRKDLVIRAGRNIHPDEIEEAVGGLDGIRQGCVVVFGLPDQEAGTERLVVVAESRRRGEESRQDLRRRITALVTDLAGGPPDDIVLVPPNSVPKTSSGKIRRSACRALYEQGRLGRGALPVWIQVARFVLAGMLDRLRRAGQLARDGLQGAWAWGLLAGVAAPASVVYAMLPGTARRWRFAGAVLRALARLAGLPLRVTGREHLGARPTVLVGNHASYLDALLLVGVLPDPVCFVAKAEVARNPVLRFLLDRLGVVYVERFDTHRSVADAKRLAVLAKTGHRLFFFAEGTFSRRAGLLPFRTGAFETAVKAGLDVTPVVIRGSRAVLRSGSWFPRPGPVTITIGPAIALAEAGQPAATDAWRTAMILRDRCRAWILQRCGEPDLDSERPTVFQIPATRSAE